MKEYKIICDCCGKKIERDKHGWFNNDEYTELGAHWGYASDGMDGDEFSIIVCSQCFKKIWKQFFPNYRPNDRYHSPLEDYTQEELDKHLKDKLLWRLAAWNMTPFDLVDRAMEKDEEENDGV